MPMSLRRNRAPSDLVMRRPTPKISMPVALQSSTNLQLNDMMDLAAAQKMMAERKSFETPTPITATEPELTDGSSVSSSPVIEPNHLSSYFPGPAGLAAKAADKSAPSIPSRVPSHSKREHERLARKRSLRGSRSTDFAAANQASSSGASTGNARTSLELIGVNGPEPLPKTSTPAKHRSPRLDNSPFSPELEQLTEAVEESLRQQPEIEDEDAVYMRSNGLVRYDVAAYCDDIGDCYALPSAPFDAGFQHQESSAWI